MCVAKTRALAEDIADLVELDLEELPAVVDAQEMRRGTVSVAVHEEWPSPFFLETMMDTGIDAVAKTAPIVVKREYSLSRDKVDDPLEGKAVLAYWDHLKGQLVVYTSTQVPHMIRTAIAEHLGLEQKTVRSRRARRRGAGLATNAFCKPKSCYRVAGLSFKKPFRWVEDRRETPDLRHLLSGRAFPIL